MSDINALIRSGGQSEGARSAAVRLGLQEPVPVAELTTDDRLARAAERLAVLRERERAAETPPAPPAPPGPRPGALPGGATVPSVGVSVNEMLREAFQDARWGPS